MQNLKLIKLKSTELPRKLGELIHSNQFLKLFSITSLCLVGLMLVAVIVMATKEPTVITLNVDGVKLEKTTTAVRRKMNPAARARLAAIARARWAKIKAAGKSRL